MLLRCHLCDKHLPVEAFTRRSSSRGYQYGCRECRAEQNRQRRARKREASQLAAELKAKPKEQGPAPAPAPEPPAPEPPPTRAAPKRKPRLDTQTRHAHKVAQAVLDGVAVTEDTRQLSLLLRAMVMSQLELFYSGDDLDAPERVANRELLDQVDFELKDALSRLSKRMRNARQRREAHKTSAFVGVMANRDRVAAAHLLGVQLDATPQEIEQAYKKQARTAHPDLGGDTEDMQALNAARAALLEGQYNA